MKIKLDENLPTRLVAALAQLGHDADTVARERLTGRPDVDIWRAAQNAGRFLITQDLDFSDARRFRPGTHHGLLLVRLREPGRNALLQRVHAIFQTEDAESWRGCFVVVTEHKLRVRRPTGNRVQEKRATYRVRRRAATR
jgi:predicted nuclease of predicted toxin-antitoxin system